MRQGIFLPESIFSVFSVLLWPYSPRVQSCALSTSVFTLKIQKWHWQPYYCLDTRIYCTHRLEWVALHLRLLCLTRVRRPDWISRKGLNGTKKHHQKAKNNNTCCCRQYAIPDSNIPDNSKFCERALILRRAPCTCTDQTFAQFLIFGLSHKKTGQDQREIRTCSSERIRTWRAINTSVLIVTFCSTNLIYRIYVGGSIHVEEAAGSESLGKDDG